MTTAHRMTDLQTRALAAFIHESRPDWDTPGVVASLRAIRDDVDAWTLAIAMIRGAADPKNRTPGAPRYANNRCWDVDQRPSCSVHGQQPRRSDTGECAACYADRTAREAVHPCMAELCVHEMVPGECSWCSGRDGGEAVEAARIAKLRETWSGWRADYAGRCASCGGPLVPGDPIKTARVGRGWRGPCCITDADLPKRPVL